MKIHFSKLRKCFCCATYCVKQYFITKIKLCWAIKNRFANFMKIWKKCSTNNHGGVWSASGGPLIRTLYVTKLLFFFVEWRSMFSGKCSKAIKESKARQNFRKRNISYPLIRTRTCAYQEVRNICFSEILACFAFLKHPFWDLRFCFITDEMSIFEGYLVL